MNVTLRPITQEELVPFYRAMGVVFSFDPTPEDVERFAEHIELDRLRAAFDGSQIVATFGAFSKLLTVPGGALPMAGTTLVTVQTTHRRQGLLRQLIEEHLAEVRQRGEPLAGLWASEDSIYGRFGYGPASERVQIKINKRFAQFSQPADIRGAVRLVDHEETLRVVPEIFAHVAASRPGMFQREPAWWEHRLLADPVHLREGASALRRVVFQPDGEPTGYALYSTKIDLELHDNRVHVREVMAKDRLAEKSLWQYLFNVDLCDSIVSSNRPVDDPLRWWLQQPRRMDRHTDDGLWVRLVDVPSALAGRKYSRDGEIVFGHSDPVCPWNEGTYRLSVDSNGNAACQRCAESPRMHVSPFALGAVYLGGQRFQDLARAGVIAGDPDALSLADAMFRWDPLPWCQEIF